ncbi:MAG: FIST C-terminal domain-containing protein [Lachnospiraceae bacterium]|nr:FIST C-terminal domain-containing protein [Lachnospiraceae bacterium]
MKSESGISRNANVISAVDEVFKGVTKPVGILFYCDYNRLEEFTKVLHERYPSAQTIGTAGRCYFNGTVDDTNIFVATAFTDEAKICAGVMKHLAKAPLSDLNNLENALREIDPDRTNTVCLEICTNNEERLVSTMNVALSKYGVDLVGGTTFGTPEGKKSKVCVNGTIYENACAFMVIKNLSGNVFVYKENIYTRTNFPTHVATKVNRETKELVQLDNRPAAEVYAEDTGVARGDIVGNVFQQPLGRVLGDDVYICSMYDIGSNGSLVNYKQFGENDAVTVLQLQDYEAIIEDTKNEIRNACAKIDTMISFNCIYRYLLFEQEGYTNRYFASMAEVCNNLGYVAGGEQFKRQHVNQTMVCAVFE